ncbi:MAG: glycerol-3-phosphate 1-O-acyltransferase PlsY [Candidatus Omnitrophota bacterium]
MWLILGILINYLIGSIPTAYIFGRLLKGIDIRQYGSGNVGATNALRVLGKGVGITVLALDIVKGFLPLLLWGDFFALRSSLRPEIVYIILGVSCICGHNWTIFLNFKGGKGIATTLGMLLAIAVKIPGLGVIIGLVLIIWAGAFIICRIVSLSSIIAAAALPLLMIIFKQQIIMIIAGVILSAFTIYRHKSNITRLLQGKEPTIRFK